MAKSDSNKSDTKAYSPSAVEQRIFDQWLKHGHFAARPGTVDSNTAADFKPDPNAPVDRRPPFCVVIPPPNVTGALHLGHALNNTLQDILVRQKRMAGFNSFWLIGTDHAGIATQATVEKTIRKDEGLSRHDLGRDELVKRIWAWKDKFGGRIVEQLKLMGCSCDYGRERFTLDDGCAKAVRETFFKMFRDGLIYRGKRLVNWDTQLQTAVADDEVYHETVKGHFYHFKYPFVEAQGGEPTHVHIATTRPETMLADTAVAVHPDPAGAMDRRERELRERLVGASAKDRPDIDKSLADLAERRTTHLPTLLKLRDMAQAGRRIRLPLMDRDIPLISDEWADPTLGTGCVKITPGHDANDYGVYQRHPEIGILNVMTPDGRVNEHGGAYKGLKFEEARKKVVADLEALGLVEKIEDREIELAHSDRSKAQIEPYLSDQWFVKMGDLTAEEAARVQSQFMRAYFDKARNEPRASASGQMPGLAQMAMDAICHDDAHYDDPAARKGCAKVHIFPRRYCKTYLDWLGEKRDWCISRQLWWGHRIPVWSLKVLGGEPTELHAFLDKLDKWKSAGGISIWGRMLSDDVHEKFDSEFICVRDQEDSEIIDELRKWGFDEDPDVLDTWFSSALWPHSTLGWPGEEGPLADARGSSVSSLASARGSSSDSQATGLSPQAASRKPQAPPDLSQFAIGNSSLLNFYYPTSVLSTAREIITLWVARMVLTGLYNVGDIPFHDVVIHPVIQDGQGRKMSKTLGNGVDPVDIIDKYGADALRFTLAELATETQDIRMPVKKEKLPDGREINVSEKFEKGRNFCNKVWQASTGFILSRLEGYDPQPLTMDRLRLEDRWILSRLTGCIAEMDQALAAYQFSAATQAAYRFFWDDYCAWYIEMAKSRLTPGTDAGANADRAVCQQVLVFVLDQALRLLHPIAPFVTEAVWAELNAAAPRRGIGRIFTGEPMLVAGAWPSADASWVDVEIDRRMAVIQSIIKDLREIRTTVNGYRAKDKQPALKTLPSATVLVDAAMREFLAGYDAMIRSLGGCDALAIRADGVKPAGALGRVQGLAPVYAPIAAMVNVAEVIDAIQKKLEELRAALAKAEAQLANEGFIARADPAMVEQTRERVAAQREQITALEQQMKGLE